MLESDWLIYDIMMMSSPIHQSGARAAILSASECTTVISVGSRAGKIVCVCVCWEGGGEQLREGEMASVGGCQPGHYPKGHAPLILW